MTVTRPLSIFFGPIAALLFAAGCGSSADASPDDATNQNLAAGDVVADTYARAIASQQPEATGVDEWDLQVVTRSGQQLVVALGYASAAPPAARAEVLEVWLQQGSFALLRGPASQPIQIAPEREKAIGADLVALAPFGGEDTTQSLGIHVEGLHCSGTAALKVALKEAGSLLLSAVALAPCAADYVIYDGDARGDQSSWVDQHHTTLCDKTLTMMDSLKLDARDIVVCSAAPVPDAGR